jgi:hypothetical protein
MTLLQRKARIAAAGFPLLAELWPWANGPSGRARVADDLPVEAPPAKKVRQPHELADNGTRLLRMRRGGG